MLHCTATSCVDIIRHQVKCSSQTGLTAAHRSLPFGTCLVVGNPKTGKTVSVRVNDRGPFVAGLTLDLSSGAARAIGMRSTEKGDYEALLAPVETGYPS